MAQNWHKKETHGVPEDSVFPLMYLGTPVSGAQFLQNRLHKIIARIGHAVMVESIKNDSDHRNRRGVAEQS